MNGRSMIVYTLESMFLASTFCGVAHPQEQGQSQNAAPSPAASDPQSLGTPAPTIQLTVSKDTPLQIALDKEVRLEKSGQALARPHRGTSVRVR